MYTLINHLNLTQAIHSKVLRAHQIIIVYEGEQKAEKLTKDLKMQANDVNKWAKAMGALNWLRLPIHKMKQ